MKKGQYSNGVKTIIVLLQMICLVVVIVIFSLVVNLFGRSMLSFTDIGNDSFFHSTYYMGKIAEATEDLTEYLYLQMENPKNRQEKYKQYKLQFDDEAGNFYYWFSLNDKIFTNMEGETEAASALEQAEKFGSYLYYNDETISFEGDIRRLNQDVDMDILRLFRNGEGDGKFIMAVDTNLPQEDVFSDAKKVYDVYFPWVEAGLMVAVIALVCFVLCMIYITLATGRNNQDDKIHLYRIDYFPTEILFLVFVSFVGGLIAFSAKLSNMKWEILNSLILTGTLVFLSDVVLLTLYLSFVRKIKADIFISCSITSYVIRTLKEGMSRQRMVGRTIIRFGICGILALFFSWEAFSERNIWAMAGLFLVFIYAGIHFLQQAVQRKKILEGIIKISSGSLDYKFNIAEYTGDYKELAEKINDIGAGLSSAVEENVKNERLKTELITNVSHDIKTPLTSIINYINLIKMERIQNERLENYVNILEKKSLRLKQLTEDLVEVSKITSGNITLDMQPINMVELIFQTGGEFNEIFEEKGLTIVTRLPKEPVMIMADGNRIWRVIQNLYNNVAKYALSNTRVYVELKENEGKAEFSIKDVSAQELKNTSQDLSERFVRGDESRGTEGSGLGLSIAKNLTNLMGGTFAIEVDDDLFTARITFPVYGEC